MWIPPEDIDPIVLHAPTRKGVSIFGAVQIKTGKLVTSLTPKFDAETFQEFLKCLVSTQYRGVKLYVILDNARYHHAKLLSPWLEDNKDKIELVFLPPYSPELNPIERVWKLLRRLCTHNQYFPTLVGLIDTLQTQFKLWDEPNPALQRLCVIT